MKLLYPNIIMIQKREDVNIFCMVVARVTEIISTHYENVKRNVAHSQEVT